MNVKQYRRKEIIEAMQYDGINFYEISQWVIKSGGRAYCSYTATYSDPPENLFVVNNTIYGDSEVNPNDWVVKQFDGEFRVIKASWFGDLYEEATND